MVKKNEQDSTTQPRRQKAYELLHAFCRMITFVDETKFKGVYGDKYILMNRISLNDLKKCGFDNELIEFLIEQIKKHQGLK